MALHFHKIPVFNSAKTLNSLISRYAEYTKKVDYPTIDEDSYEMCRESTALLESAINQIKEGRENLTKLYNEIREEYQNCKNKSDKKDIMLEIEQIENESQLHKELASADELIFMLTARHDESKCIRGKMGVKLGYISQRSLILQNVPSESSDAQNSPEQEQIQVETNSRSDNSHSQATSNLANLRTENNARQVRSIKPPQGTLPKFYGDAEEFPEYWAIFEALVHNSPDLDVMEKILLLKESLKGRAEASIKGIKLLPQNYEWIIRTLKENYCNQPTNRSQVVQRLVNLKPANETVDSCSAIFDQIQILVNQMVSAGYDVRKTCDPMWCETILAKFPRDIVKPVLISGQTMPMQTIEDLMGQPKKEVAAKCYVENRLGHSIEHRYDHAIKDEVITMRDDYPSRHDRSQRCIFCQSVKHMSATCETVTDRYCRRSILKEQRRCWKCFSPNHNSYDCAKPDCSQCGQKHHITLCYKTSNNQSVSNQRMPWNQAQQVQLPMNANHLRTFNPRHDETHNSVNPNITKALMCTENRSYKHSDNSCVNSQVVMMTAEGSVWNYRSEAYEKIVFLFDTGAQKTLIQESLAVRFGLPRDATEVCTMSGIGGHTEKFESHRVRVKISTAFGEGLEFEFQTKPVITNGFSSVNLTSSDRDFLEVKGICLANSKLRGEHLTPLILVGLDYYHELVESYASGTKTPSGLYISKTIFGPVIYGKGEIPPQHIETKKDIAYGLTAIFEQAKEGMVQNQQPNPSLHLPRPYQKIDGHFIVKQKAVPRGNPQHGQVKEGEKLKNTSIRLKGSNLNHRIFHSLLKKPWTTVKSRPSNQTLCKTGQLEQQRAVAKNNPQQPEIRPILQRKSNIANFDRIRYVEKDFQRSSQPPSLSVPMLILAVLALISPAPALSNTSCAQLIVNILSVDRPFASCSNDECRNITNQTSRWRYNLAPDEEVVERSQQPYCHETPARDVIYNMASHCILLKLNTKCLMNTAIFI